MKRHRHSRVYVDQQLHKEAKDRSRRKVKRRMANNSRKVNRR